MYSALKCYAIVYLQPPYCTPILHQLVLLHCTAWDRPKGMTTGFWLPSVRLFDTGNGDTQLEEEREIN